MNTKNKLINTVIYSKDRSMQLMSAIDSFLECFADKDCANITVIYKGSTQDYENAYNSIVVPKYPTLKFTREQDFKKDTLEAIDTNCKYTMFIMDDIFFYNKWSLEDEPFKLLERYPDGIIAVSLRLSKQTNYCYPIGRNQEIPSFHKNCAWKWTEADGDFGYPMSLDGNVFHTNKILDILAKIPDERFTHPNTLEGALNEFAQMRKSSGAIPQVMVCYSEASRLFNNPCNRVQNIIENKNEGSYSAEQLNDLLLSGKSIDIEETLKDIKSGKMIVNAAHFPIEVVIK